MSKLLSSYWESKQIQFLHEVRHKPRVVSLTINKYPKIMKIIQNKLIKDYKQSSKFILNNLKCATNKRKINRVTKETNIFAMGLQIIPKLGR